MGYSSEIEREQHAVAYNRISAICRLFNAGYDVKHDKQNNSDGKDLNGTERLVIHGSQWSINNNGIMRRYQ